MSKSAPESESHSGATACVSDDVCLLFDWRSYSLRQEGGREDYASTKQTDDSNVERLNVRFEFNSMKLPFFKTYHINYI